MGRDLTAPHNGKRVGEIRVSGFDLGTEGAVFRAKRDENGDIVPLSTNRWKWKGGKSGMTDEERYHEFSKVIDNEVEWSDVVGYELVQFNRGKSTIEGMRAILAATALKHDRMAVGVNVATLKAFARSGMTAKKRKGSKVKDIDKKVLMRVLLQAKYPEFFEVTSVPLDDNQVDAAWVCIWLLENIT